MAETFEDLGLGPELVRATRRLGYAGPTALQRAAIPVLRRGGNAVLYEGPGAGVVGAYGLALMERLGEGAGEGAGGSQALVLVPTGPDASRTALSLARFARPLGLRAAAPGSDWGAPVREADVVVATPSAALEAVQGSSLKLDTVRALVLDGLSVLFDLGYQEAVETLTTFVPREAQRVVVSAERTDAVEDYVERHVRRALSIPPTPIEEAGPPAGPAHRCGYAVVAEGEKLAALAVVLGSRAPGGAAVVYARTDERAAELAEELALRGFETGAEGPVRVAATAQEAAGALAISYDMPFDPEGLAARHAAGGLVLVEPRMLAHLRLIAERAGFALHAEPVAVPPARDAVSDFRDRLRRALAEEDLEAQLVVLEPLFTEFSAAEVAAAASALLRRRAPAPVAAAAVRPAAPARPAAPEPFVRLFVSVGTRDGVRPGDLVGAITGEANVPGDKIGRIDLRENLAIVEVASDIAERVIQALNGTTMRGRSLRVDYDRRAGGARGEGARPAGRVRRPPTREFGR